VRDLRANIQQRESGTLAGILFGSEAICKKCRLSAGAADEQCLYYFFIVVIIIRHETTATACRALTFIVRIFVNDTITIAVWTSFHVYVPIEVGHNWIKLHTSFQPYRGFFGVGKDRSFHFRPLSFLLR
jgi:hypothetical protein